MTLRVQYVIKYEPMLQRSEKKVQKVEKKLNLSGQKAD